MEYLYKVKHGDTVLSVCLSFDLTYERFAEFNPDFNILGHRYMDQLKIGEHLVVGRRHDIFDRLRLQEKGRRR